MKKQLQATSQYVFKMNLDKISMAGMMGPLQNRQKMIYDATAPFLWNFCNQCVHAHQSLSELLLLSSRQAQTVKRAGESRDRWRKIVTGLPAAVIVFVRSDFRDRAWPPAV